LEVEEEDFRKEIELSLIIVGEKSGNVL